MALEQILDLIEDGPPTASLRGLAQVSGITVPSDAVAGYAVGCIFQHIDGGGGTAFYVNEGSATSCAFKPVSPITSVTIGTGITGGGPATVCNVGVERTGPTYKTTFLLDITGLRSTAGDDIIGLDGTALACHIGQITAAVNGTIIAGKITCFETPASGDPDIDLYSAVEGTGVEDDAISGLDETKLINHGDWTAEDVDMLDALPAADEYLYLVAGDTTDADYTAGIFLIELWGT